MAHFQRAMMMDVDQLAKAMGDVEIEDCDRHGSVQVLPPGCSWWVIVRQVAPGVRMRLPFAAPAHLPAETTEEIASQVWSLVSTSQCDAATRGLEQALAVEGAI